MKKATLKGMNDYLPKEVRIRDYLQNKILEVYESAGFERIITPIVEDIENLDKSEGGDNLNLIFKILKRGDKLDKAMEEGNAAELADMGLRYDLTLPLSRYFANNKAKLMYPMKCIQIDRVYRAERPQKGRLREFVQCDIDILGSSSVNCEIELIDTTTKALLAIGINNFKVKINNRRILKSMLLKAGFEEAQLDSVCIIFDKLDKIGKEGIQKELQEKEYAEVAINNLLAILEECPLSIEKVKEVSDDMEAVEEVEAILKAANALANGQYEVVFDISLVRGQGYYTGTVFEVESIDFRGAIAGGGRYDHLIGKFTGEQVPAVGFSIGFERIYSILLANDFVIPDKKKRIAVLYDGAEFVEASKKAMELREMYEVALFEKPKKVGKFLNRLEEQEYFGFYILGESEEVTVFGDKK